LQPTGPEVSTTRISPACRNCCRFWRWSAKIRIKNRLARTLLETYVGSHAGELILAARPGVEADDSSAAIMICDLREFTGFPTTGRAMTSLIS